MTPLTGESVPRLTPGCRLNEPGSEEDLLLIPEGALQLKGPARTIVELCDGQRTLAGIVDELQHRYPGADGARIEAETAALLTRLRERGAMETV